MKALIAPLLLLTAIIVGCSSKTDPAAPNPQDTTHKDTTHLDTTHQDTTGLSDSLARQHAAGKGYDKSRGGVQIVTVRYDQTYNGTLFGVTDEWVVLQSDKNVYTRGWMLDASDNQRFPLPDSIYKSLTIYTHTAPTPSPLALSLNISPNIWLWNNSVTDTASIYDDKNNLIDRLIYKGK